VTAAHELGKDARKASRALRGDARFLVLTDLIASPRADAVTWSDVAKVLNAPGVYGLWFMVYGLGFRV